jgi:hypothetical protein
MMRRRMPWKLLSIENDTVKIVESITLTGLIRRGMQRILPYCRGRLESAKLRKRCVMKEQPMALTKTSLCREKCVPLVSARRSVDAVNTLSFLIAHDLHLPCPLVLVNSLNYTPSHA